MTLTLVTEAPAPVRRCIACRMPIDGDRKLYCDFHRQAALRISWRDSKRRKRPLKGIVE